MKKPRPLLKTTTVRDAEAAAITRDISEHVHYTAGRDLDACSPQDLLEATCLATRRRILDVQFETERRREITRPKRVYYLSMEFLIGRSLMNNLLNLGMKETAVQALQDLDSDLDSIAALEHDAALGNGGLGRLAACFIDSMATLDIAGVGCGIRYDYGLFRQEIIGGRQREKPDSWNADSSPWLLERSADIHQIPIYGHVEEGFDADGRYNPMWVDWQTLMGMPYDMPIAGFGGKTVNMLRLYAARPSDSFDMDTFNGGDYIRAVEKAIASENVSKVLYPSDAFDAGKELRLIQEYFLVACSLRDVMKTFAAEGLPIECLPDRVAIQMNDTHPALAVAELMRVLVDEHDVAWDQAWAMTRATLAYTNHTLLPEALEKWSVDLFGRVLPRHLQIIFEINRQLLAEVDARWPQDGDRAQRMSLIEEGGSRKVRMANLAIVGSHSVNGVAALHSELLKTQLVPDFHEFYPQKFNNKTNGVTPRRWILQANPHLAALLSAGIGPGWVTDLDSLRGLEPLASDSSFLEQLAGIKHANKERLAKCVYDQQRLRLDPSSIFDIQSKRIHEYKRQLMNLLHVIHRYLRIVDDGAEGHPRTHVFSGKAAPGYFMAKLIVQAINEVAEVINRDERCKGRLSVAFVVDYNVSVAEWIMPAADLSEQISTAGLEASGTGNMKFAMNGALTIGTHDGANIEMAQDIGAENLYLFGLKAHEVDSLRQSGAYRPRELYESDDAIRRILDALVSRFSADAGALRPLFDHLVWHDTYFVLADLPEYIATQDRAETDYSDRMAWARRSLLNIARSGRFSSDRTIREYASEIWRA
jgi:glycogen phosphorylase